MPNGKKTLRIGLMSRIDYGSDGFRKGALEWAKRKFALTDVAFVVLVGGLVSGREIKQKSVRLGKELRLVTRQLNAVLKEIKRTERLLNVPKQKKGKGAEPQDSPAKQKEMEVLHENLEKLLRQEEAFAKQKEYFEAGLAALTPESLARQLDEIWPSFTNAKGETVKLYIVTSPAYDQAIGEEVARLLSDYRSKRELRLLSSTDDLMPLFDDRRWLEILTALKAAWMRGDFFSTPVERLIKDKRRQSSRPVAPDIDVVGCFGSTITKPRGEFPVPYVSLPVLHRIRETTVNENQIGVRVMELSLDRKEPVMFNFSLKDSIGRERSFIGGPAKPSPELTKILDVIRKYGKRTTGMLSDATGLSSEKIRQMLKTLLVKKGEKPRKSWPGLVYDEHSDRWDFDLDWVMLNLEYPDPEGEAKSDSIVGVGCPHIGSRYTCYGYFMREVLKAVLEREAGTLAVAGDIAEGLKYSKGGSGENVGGMNVTQMEAVAAWMLYRVMHQVFQVRFDRGFEALKASGQKPSQEQVVALVKDSIVLLLWIVGNHDLWMSDNGWTPLTYMSLVIQRLLASSIEDFLLEKGLRVDRLSAIVRDKVVNPPDGEWVLPSGLKQTMMHPHMSRTKTTSIRPQEMLAMARDSQIVLGANFHVSEHVEEWDPVFGQRVCLELGTIKWRSDFETHKLKVVDNSFGWVRVDSVIDPETKKPRIVSSQNTFVTNEGPADEDPEVFVRQALDALKKLGIEF